MSRGRASCAALAIALLVLAGCGQRGPLRLPEPEPPPAGADDTADDRASDEATDVDEADETDDER